MSTSYTKGLKELGDGIFAYLVPDGSWGYSNAGLITSGDESMLIDTLNTPSATKRMIADMRRSLPAIRSFDTIVNSHADGDHTWGNQLFEGARIISTVACAEDLTKLTPDDIGKLCSGDPRLDLRARYMQQIFPFDLSEIDLTLPNKTFEGKLTMQVGEMLVDLYELGPAHSRGDLIVHVPEADVVYAADLVYVGVHPSTGTGAGTLGSWLEALDRILEFGAAIVVPGRGPLTDNDGLRRFRDYLQYVDAEGRRLHGEGVSRRDAALTIDLSDYKGWKAEERIVLTIDAVYRELDGEPTDRDPVTIWREMAYYCDSKGQLH